MSRLGRVLRDRGVQRRMGAAALSGVLLALAFPAFDIGALALVALVPLVWAWRGETPGRAALYGFVFGVVFAGILMYWLWYFGIVAIVPLVAGWAAYTALTGYLVGCLNRAGLRSPWLIAAAWVVPEALRGRWPFGGLPWGDLGVALHDFPPARAVASWGGVALVSFVLVVFNAYLVELAVALRGARAAIDRRRDRGCRRGRRARRRCRCGALPDPPVGRAAGRRAPGQRPGPLPDDRREAQRIPHRAALRAREPAAGTVRPGGVPRIVARRLQPREQPEPPQPPGRGGSPARRGRARRTRPSPRPTDATSTRTLLYTPDGRLAGTYSKEHLVPFGEYVPFRSLVDWTGIVDRIPYDYTPGKERTIFRVKGHRLATVICFESAFGPLVRDFVDRGAEVVVVSTNNRSYRRSGNSAQHIAQTQMRAAETGRPFLQASISGMSAVDRRRRRRARHDEAVPAGLSSATRSRRPPARRRTCGSGSGWWPSARCCSWGPRSSSRVRRPRATVPKLAEEQREPVGSGRVT